MSPFQRVSSVTKNRHSVAALTLSGRTVHKSRSIDEVTPSGSELPCVLRSI